MTTDRAASSKQVSLFAVKWQPKKDQPLPWEIRQKLCKPKGGRNKKGDDDNFHNRDYDFVSPSGEIFTGKGVRQFALLHGLNEVCLYAVLDGRVHSHRGWTKAVGGRKLPVPPTYYFLSPSGEIHTTTNLSEFARQHSLDPIALSRTSRCIRGAHRGWRHCTPDGQPIVPPDKKHRKFILISPTGETVEGSNLKAFAEQNGLSRGCLMNVLDGTSAFHKGWKLPATSTTTTKAATLKNFPTMNAISTTGYANALNLGKVFEMTVSRLITDEDVLAPGDWIKEIGNPFCYNFKSWDGDMAIGVWVGKEFLVPRHLLQVCTAIDDKRVEKFCPKPVAQFKVGDRVVSRHPLCLGQVFEIAKYPNVYANGSVSYESLVTTTDLVLGIDQVSLVEDNQGIKVGDRIQHKVDPQGLGYSGIILEIDEKAQSARVLMEDGHTHTFYTEGLKLWLEPIKFKKGDRVRDTFPSSKGRIGTITKTSKQWSMVLWDDAEKPERWRHLEIAPKRTSGTDLGFKVGDRVISRHRLSLGQIFEIAEYPDEDATGLVSFDWLVTTTNLVLHVDKVSLVSEDSCFDSGSIERSRDAQHKWNPDHFGEVPHQIEASGQTTIFFDDSNEPPDPDDFETVEEYEEAWKQWELRDVPSNFKFAYKQLRQKGISHQDAIAILFEN